MDASTVAEAVAQLRARGEKISIRNVHGITGGSFRDLSMLLAQQGSSVAVDEEEEPRGLLPQATYAVRKAEGAYAEAQQRLEDAIARQDTLRRSPDPSNIGVALAGLKETIPLLQQQVEARRTELDKARQHYRNERDRLTALRKQVTSLRESMPKALQEEDMRKRDAEHAHEMAKRHIEGLKRAIVANEAEIQALLGE